MRKLISIAAIVLLVGILTAVGVLYVLFWADREVPPVANLSSGPVSDGVDLPEESTIVRNLDIPWDLGFLPNGDILITEREGRLRLFTSAGGLQEAPVATFDDVAAEGEGGLLGFVLHPQFDQNQFVYLYATYRDGSALKNQVRRYRYQDAQLEFDRTILADIPGSQNHNGGRMLFGPDGFLYIATGDAQVPELAQDQASLAGKILRLRDDGGVPADNPFTNSLVYSFGHRNPQGLTFDQQGNLWASEHGSSAHDELNKITAGANYGWPEIRGAETREGMRSPMLESGNDTWAPSGLASLGDTLYFAGLRGQTLYSVNVATEPLVLQEHLQRKHGRLRRVVVGPDQALYLLTNNRDGRGVPRPEDDLLIRIEPQSL